MIYTKTISFQSASQSNVIEFLKRVNTYLLVNDLGLEQVKAPTLYQNNATTVLRHIVTGAYIHFWYNENKILVILSNSANVGADGKATNIIKSASVPMEDVEYSWVFNIFINYHSAGNYTVGFNGYKSTAYSTTFAIITSVNQSDENVAQYLLWDNDCYADTEDTDGLVNVASVYADFFGANMSASDVATIRPQYIVKGGIEQTGEKVPYLFSICTNGNIDGNILVKIDDSNFNTLLNGKSAYLIS